MNPYSEDHPDLTRIALNELPTAESIEIHDALEQNPALQVEVAAIQEIASQLRAQAPIHDLHLTPQQRQRVLRGPIAKPIAPRPRTLQRTHPAKGRSWTFLGAVTRIAAMLALLFSAFWVGYATKDLKTTEGLAAADLADDQTPSSPSNRLPSPPSGAIIAENQPPLLIAEAPSEPLPATPNEPAPPVATPPSSDKTVADAGSEKSEPEKVVGSTAFAQANPKVTPTLATHLGITEPAVSVDFINASRRGNDTLAVQPKRIRPSASSASKNLQAKPLTPSSKPTPAAVPRGRPDLFVHAWRSEVASCPWNAEHRLLRITIQLPSDQEAAQIGDHAYPLDIAFDPNNVREFRRLCSRHYPSAGAGQAGKVVVWYEFQPNGSPAETHGNGKHIANVRLAAARFTTQAVGPFDASQVQVLDRGQSWQQAREDFVFESAQVGLHLLMNGAPKLGQLNHQLVMQLAEHPQSADPDGSRAYFVKTLREVQKLTGR